MGMGMGMNNRQHAIYPVPRFETFWKHGLLCRWSLGGLVDGLWLPLCYVNWPAAYLGQY